MKILRTLSVMGLVLALTDQSTNAWVAYGRGGYAHVGYAHVGYGCCYHAGYACGGVCTGTAVAAGLTGLAVGAAVARANTGYVAPAYNPYYVAPPPVVVAPSARIGSIYYSLPYGYQPAYVNGVQYYTLGGTYYRPYWGGNGVYYTVVPNPI